MVNSVETILVTCGAPGCGGSSARPSETTLLICMEHRTARRLTRVLFRTSVEAECFRGALVTDGTEAALCHWLSAMHADSGKAFRARVRQALKERTACSCPTKTL